MSLAIVVVEEEEEDEDWAKEEEEEAGGDEEQYQLPAGVRGKNVLQLSSNLGELYSKNLKFYSSSDETYGQSKCFLLETFDAGQA